MLLLPYKELELCSNLSPDEVIKKLVENIKPPDGFFEEIKNSFTLDSSDRDIFVGNCADKNFKIFSKCRTKGSPTSFGKIIPYNNGSEIKVTISLFSIPKTTLFVMFCISLIICVANHTAIIAVFFIASVNGTVVPEAKKVQNFLCNILEAKEIKPERKQ